MAGATDVRGTQGAAMRDNASGHGDGHNTYTRSTESHQTVRAHLQQSKFALRPAGTETKNGTATVVSDQTFVLGRSPRTRGLTHERLAQFAVPGVGRPQSRVTLSNRRNSDAPTLRRPGAYVAFVLRISLTAHASYHSLP